MTVITTALHWCTPCAKTTTASVHRDGSHTCLTCMTTNTTEQTP